MENETLTYSPCSLTRSIIKNSCLILFCICLLQRCFSRHNVTKRSEPRTDTVLVMHFIIAPAENQKITPAVAEQFIRDSKEACDWISAQAKASGVQIQFREEWAKERFKNEKKTGAGLEKNLFRFAFPTSAWPAKVCAGKGWHL